MLEQIAADGEAARAMPEICFFGIIIAIFYEDRPPPHFRVRYDSQQAIIAIEPLLVLEGRLAPRVLWTCGRTGNGASDGTRPGLGAGSIARTNRADCPLEYDHVARLHPTAP